MNKILIPAFIVLYITLGLAGIKYGLPNKNHMMSYAPDELYYIEGLTILKNKRSLNPYPEFHNPTFYLYFTGAVIKTLSMVNILNISADKSFYVNKPFEWAKFYITGRALQILFGAAGIFFLYKFTRLNYGYKPAVLAAFLYSITPVHIAASHFNQVNVLVAAQTILCFWLLTKALKEKNTGLFMLAGFIEGIALATKYSSLPMVFVMAGSVFLMAENRLKYLLVIGASILAGLFVSMPYLFLDFKSFYGQFKFFASANVGTPMDDKGFFRLIMPFAWPLKFGMGLAMVLLCVPAAVYGAVKRNKADILLVLWLLMFYLFTVHAGRAASPSRLLIAAPVLIALVSRFMIEAGEKYGKAAEALPVIVFLNMAHMDASLIIQRHMTPLQESVSRWVEDNIPVTAKIALPRLPFYWTPDTIYLSYYHPERARKAYNVVVLDYDIDTLKKENPEYILSSYVELHNISYTMGKDEFRKYVLAQKDYELIKVFPRNTGRGFFKLKREEVPLFLDDDLWSASLYLYKRKVNT